jgi:hypothetical protein
MAILMVVGLLVLILAGLAFVTEADEGWFCLPIGVVALLATSVGYAYFEPPFFLISIQQDASPACPGSG